MISCLVRDWNNPEGHRCPYDFTKPIPVQMSSQGLQIVPAKFFFNNDLEYLRGGSNDKKYTASTTKSKAARYAILEISHWQSKRQYFYGYTTKIVSKHDVYSTKRILSIISVKVNEWYRYATSHCLKESPQPRYECRGSFGSELSKFNESGKRVMICLYVDDMLIFGTDHIQVDLTNEFLSSRFSMKDMREADVLKKFNYFDCTPVSTQLEYSNLIGCLMYAMTCTKLDIAFVVGKLSMYTITPVLEGYIDASWINNTEDNSSTSGWVFLLGEGAISWAYKKQTCITSSRMKYEFVALAAAGKEAECVVPLAKAYSQMYNGKSRHLGVRHSMIRGLITNGSGSESESDSHI
ncbi:hypothetical protein Tco_0967272 [Tanacetum coccineum]